MAIAVLTYANRAKIAEALTERGYPVTRMTVNRWAAGAEMPPIASRMILGLFGHEEAAPGVPERLDEIDRWIRAIALRVGVEPETVRALDARVGELARSLPRPAAADPQAARPARDE